MRFAIRMGLFSIIALLIIKLGHTINNIDIQSGYWAVMFGMFMAYLLYIIEEA